MLLEARPYRPFKSSEEYLEAMKEDLAEWLNTLYPELTINAENFMDRLDTGVALCKHANNVRQSAEEYLAKRQARNKCMARSMTSGLAGPILAMGNVYYLPQAKSGTFFSRDNVSNFITWCRKSLKIFECLLFETDDLIMRKNEKHVILCLLEVARRGAKFGMLAPMLVQMERQIDREIAADNRANGIGCGTQTDIDVGTTNNATTETDDLFDTDTEDEDDTGPMLVYGPQPQIVTNDLKSLDEMVRDLVEKCTCPSQFPMVRVSEGKYRIGDTKVLIFVRILRSHVMVRVGGGWDTLSHYLDKHDPCRCKAQHRSSVAARLIPRTNNNTNGIDLHKAQVIFERSPPSSRKSISTFNASSTASTAASTTAPSSSSSPNTTNALSLSPPSSSLKNRSRSPTPQRKYLNQVNIETNNTADARRSISPSPRRLLDIRKKQSSLDSTTQCDDSTPPINESSKFENISDNGSEISDEGYRSLGVIQSNTQKSKDSSLQNQNSVEDAEINARLDPTSSSDSQLTPSEEQASPLATIKPSDKPLDSNETVIDGNNKFEQLGVFITDDEITVDIANTTGLRPTAFSTRFFSEGPSSLPVGGLKPSSAQSKLPRSPTPSRRRSVDNVSIGSVQDLNSRTGLPVFNRKKPVYRSVRQPAPVTPVRDVTKPNRPSLERNSKGRSSQVLYDSNGRRVRGSASLTTSPVKSMSYQTSPLAQQLLQAASNSKNDAQILEKMKVLLTKYGRPTAFGDKTNKKPVFEDFTTAWVHNNGNLERSSSCSPPHKINQSKRSSAASSVESNQLNGDVLVAPRREKQGLSRIPGPVRQNTNLY
ncbi:GAS2L1 family protein [Megaselia abdita]